MYEIKKINKILPSKKDSKFLDQVKNNLYLEEIYNYNQKLLLKIQNKEFKDNDFVNLVDNKEKIKNIKINSIKDNKNFDSNSIKLLYSLPKNDFVLMSDKNKNIFIAKIINFEYEILSKNSEKISDIINQTNVKVRSDLYTSYDFVINNRYKIEINQNTLERVKNFFR